VGGIDHRPRLERPHSNGYSLVRHIMFDQLKLQPDSFLSECKRTAVEELLEPTRIYVEPILKILKTFGIAGMAHITGGEVLR